MLPRLIILLLIVGCCHQDECPPGQYRNDGDIWVGVCGECECINNAELDECGQCVGYNGNGICSDSTFTISYP